MSRSSWALNMYRRLVFFLRRCRCRCRRRLMNPRPPLCLFESPGESPTMLMLCSCLILWCCEKYLFLFLFFFWSTRAARNKTNARHRLHLVLRHQTARFAYTWDDTYTSRVTLLPLLLLFVPRLSFSLCISLVSHQTRFTSKVDYFREGVPLRRRASSGDTK